jgi:hypothetical protein
MVPPGRLASADHRAVQQHGDFLDRRARDDATADQQIVAIVDVARGDCRIDVDLNLRRRRAAAPSGRLLIRHGLARLGCRIGCRRDRPVGVRVLLGCDCCIGHGFQRRSARLQAAAERLLAR